LVLCAVASADTSPHRGSVPSARLALERVFAAGDDFVFSAASSANGRLVAAGRRDGKVAVWKNGVAMKPWPGHEGYVYATAVSADGRRLATGGADKTARIWDTERVDVERVLRGHDEAVHALAFTPDGRSLVSAGGDGARVWRAEDGVLLHALKHANLLAVTASHNRVATASGDGSVRLWDLATGRERRALPAHAKPVSAVAFTLEGGRIATASFDGKVRVFGVETGELLATHDAFTGVASALAFSPDGRVLAVAGSQGVKFWDAGRPGASYAPGPAAVGVTFAEGGSTAVATFADNRVRVYGTRKSKPFDDAAVERVPGFLGVSYTNEGGALVSSIIAGSQAEALGLKAGDTIVGVDATDVLQSDDFLNFMRGTKEGDEITLKIKREGADKFIRAKLGRWQ